MDFTPDQVALIKRTVAVGASDDELQLFMYVARKTGLDPFTRQIYAIKRQGKMAIQTGIDGYRVVADRTGQLAGISDPFHTSDLDAKFPLTATVTVKKLLSSGQIAEFTATARWSEYNAGGPMWVKMPFLMLGKCAEALALRKAFPVNLSGVYTSEEMAQADNDKQRDEVFAEVERQKSSHVAAPELDWAYNAKTGLLICRIKSAKKTKKKKGDGELVTIQINQPIEGKNLLYYFHASHAEAILGAVGKVVKLVLVDVESGYPKVESVMEIDGVPVEQPDAPAQLKAQLLAESMDLTVADLEELYTKLAQKSWVRVVELLEVEKARRESPEEEA
jgi:phage recombination protein Bet